MVPGPVKISVLIPFRSSDSYRMAAWTFLRPQWEALASDGVELCSTTDTDNHEERFSFARGANRCRAMASGDVLLVHGADQLLPDAATWARIRVTMQAAPWMWVYASWQELDRLASRRIIRGHDPNEVASGPVWDHNYAVYAVRADVWDEVGGLDERLVGWGPEDALLRLILRRLYPDGVDQGHGLMRALWHPQAPRDLTPRNHGFYEETLAAANCGPEALRRYLQEVRARD